MSELLVKHIESLVNCERCPQMYKPVVTCGPVVSKVMLVGQAPGVKEPELQRPFAWTAGRTLFGWFEETTGLDEAAFRQSVYMTAVCRCYPGKNPKGGDRVPDQTEIANCSYWLEGDFRILQPELVIAVGKLAIQQFVSFDRLVEVVGQVFTGERDGQHFDVIPLPHPSGLSTWPRMEPGKSLLKEALKLIGEHPAMKALKT
ncbi:MAG: uracil-DNA glycosylase [Gammaproteobacteria bacterium]|nr:uracil-DNA glycosylase [Gammaproteobacteria bacterium]|tara:strand:- start:166781 stop:167386 length:606 start_codon:yes stop_codon:yes gene_type:complete